MKQIAVFVCLFLGLAVTSASAQLHNSGFDSDLTYWLTYYENIINGYLTPGIATWDAKYDGSAKLSEVGMPGCIGLCQPTAAAIQSGDKLGLDVVFEADPGYTTFAFYIGDLYGDGQWATLIEPGPGEFHLEITADKTYSQGTFCGFKVVTWPGDATCWVKQATASILEGEAGAPPAVRPAMQVNPNPVTGRTKISFGTRQSCRGRLAVYDAAGSLVREIEARRYGTGQHSAVWNGRGEDGQSVNAGTYVVRLTTDDGREQTASVVVTH